MDLMIKHTKPKSATAEDWEKAIICLANSLVYEPTYDGHLNNEVPMKLEKHNETRVVSQETKIIERHIIAKCPGLGLEDQQLYSFMPLLEG